MANLFAYRATDPKAMKKAANPVGRFNNKWLKELASEAGLVVAAWGNDGVYQGRSKKVSQMIAKMYCLKMNRSGEPAHPLYQRADQKPIPMSA